MRFSCRIALCLALAARSAFAIDTTSVELREREINDGAVTITRSGGEMLFRDTLSGGPVALRELLGGTGDHGGLTGLADDDHGQYLTAGRHAAAHSAEWNDTLAITPDVAGNTTLGAHVRSGAIHLGRTSDEVVTGAWTFTRPLELTGGELRLSNGGETGQVTVRFRNSPSDSVLSYLPEFRVLHYGEIFSAGGIESGSGNFDQLSAPGLLTGRLGGARSGLLEGFVTIEGISHADLLSRTRDEDITGAWDFFGTATAQTVRWEHYDARTVPPSAGWSAMEGGLRQLGESTPLHLPVACQGGAIRGIRLKWSGGPAAVLEVRLLKRNDSVAGASVVTVLEESFHGSGGEVVSERLLASPEPVGEDWSAWIEVDGTSEGTPLTLVSFGISTLSRRL